MFSTRSSAARLMLIVVIGLIVLKVVAAIITGSISILAQVVDSGLDLFAVAVTFIAVRFATKPADREHPFGHGKAENIAAIVQAILIFLAGGSIIYSSVHRMMVGAKVELAEAGIGVMLVSMIASIFLSRHLFKVARAADSVALEANAHNINADIYSTAAVLVGLAVVRIGQLVGVNLNILDPIIAIGVALFILKSAYDVVRKSFGGLIDVKLPQAEEDEIVAVIKKHGDLVAGFHKIRSRKAGSQRHIDFHLVVSRDISVEKAHQLCDQLEQEIEKRLSDTSVTIHVEPCDGKCEHCSTSPDLCQRT
jgi:cation diffusion facilitator family transporter